MQCRFIHLGSASLRIALILGALAFPRSGAAQGVCVGRIVAPGSSAEDGVRRAQLAGGMDGRGFLVRSSSTMTAGFDEPCADRAFEVLYPEVRAVWNSELPFSLNDGAMWAGRGFNGMVTAGARLRLGRFTMTLAPHVLREENRPFAWIPYQRMKDPSRSEFANLYHPMPESLDLPLRFGPDAMTRAGLGQTSIRVAFDRVDVSLGTENWWWGPGVRNALLLSNQAEGFPHLTVGAARPLVTSWGDLEVRWLLGWLTESKYFDFDPTNDHRSLSAAVVTLRPRFDPGLTIGVARMVVAPLRPGTSLLGATLNAFRNVGRPNATLPDSAWSPGPDQITSLFGRWIFPGAGFELYGEWARFEQPASLSDFLQFPQHSQGYTYGLQWVDPREGSARTRVQMEVTNLEPSSTWRHRRVVGSYTSSAVPQGFTHKGQLLGAAIGPGASSQWVAVDRIGDRGWRAGVFGGRARLDAAAHFTDVVPEPKRADLLLYWGIRGGVDLWGWSVSGELSPSVRMNYLFQTYVPDPITGRSEGVDVANTSVSLTVSRTLRR